MDKIKKGVRLDHISKIYQDPKTGKNFYAVKDTSLTIEPGSFVTLLGPSGCGKTTTLRTITGFIEPAEGSVVVKGRDITRVPIEDRNIGIVFQSYALFPTMTVYDNIAFGLRVKKAKKDEIDRKVREIARKVDLSDEQLKKAVSQLSGGQQQRVAIARALVTGPAIICMDEPLSNLDAKLRVQLRNELKKMQKDFGITTIYVTHDQEEALAISDRIAVMKDGHIMQIGTPRDIYAKPQNPFVAGFIGVSNFLDCEVNAPAPGNAAVSIKGELDITVPVSRAYTGSGKISARPEQLFFSESGMPGTILFSTFLGDFIEYEVQLNDGQNLIVNEYTKDTTEIHSDGEQVHLSFDPMRISLYDKSEEVLSL